MDRIHELEVSRCLETGQKAGVKKRYNQEQLNRKQRIKLFLLIAFTCRGGLMAVPLSL